MTKPSVIVLGLIALLATTAAARTFTDTSGRSIEAELVAAQGDNVVMKKDGKEITVKISLFSIDDQVYIRDWIKKNPAPAQYDFTYFTNIERGETASAKVDYDERLKNIDYTYSFSINNRSPGPATGLWVRYQLIIKDHVDLRNDRYRELAYSSDHSGRIQRIHGSFPVDRIRQGGRVDIEQPYSLQSYIEKDSGRTDVVLTDKFLGLWIRVYRGAELIDEYKNDENQSLKSITWTDAPPDADGEVQVYLLETKEAGS